MKVHIDGTHCGNDAGAIPGDLVQLPDAAAIDYLATGLAETRLDGPLGRPYEAARPAELERLRAALKPSPAAAAPVPAEPKRAFSPAERLERLRAIW